MDGGAMFVRCHAIETDFANQTSPAATAIVITSKAISAQPQSENRRCARRCFLQVLDWQHEATPGQDSLVGNS
jgi:hypothetical protein